MVVKNISGAKEPAALIKDIQNDTTTPLLFVYNLIYFCIYAILTGGIK